MNRLTLRPLVLLAGLLALGLALGGCSKCGWGEAGVCRTDWPKPSS